MPNNQAKIRELNSVLDAGVSSVSLPNGQSTSFDLEALERRRNDLAQGDETAKAKRPVVARINLSGASA